jgi:plastocyanin
LGKTGHAEPEKIQLHPFTEAGERLNKHLIRATAVAAGFALAAPAAVAQGTPHSAAYRKTAIEVYIRNFAYHPSLLRVEKGAEVSFENRDGATHDAMRKGSFSTGLLRPGESASVRFTHRGAFPYVCSLHPGMRGKVIVR